MILATWPWPGQGGRESLCEDHLGWIQSSHRVSIQTMATTINKQKIVTQLFTTLGKHAKSKPTERPVLEQFIYAMLRENATRENADQAFKNLKDRFFDWNEVRVSSTVEIAEMMGEDLRIPET